MNIRRNLCESGEEKGGEVGFARLFSVVVVLFWGMVRSSSKSSSSLRLLPDVWVLSVFLDVVTGLSQLQSNWSSPSALAVEVELGARDGLASFLEGLKDTPLASLFFLLLLFRGTPKPTWTCSGRGGDARKPDICV
jgi:hypothetical protein